MTATHKVDDPDRSLRPAQTTETPTAEEGTQSAADGSSTIDFSGAVEEGIKSIFDWITSLFADGLTTGYEVLSTELFDTPVPRTDGAFVFGTPTNAPWPALHETLVGGEVMFVSLLLLLLCVQARHTIRIFNVGSAYEAHLTTRNAWVGAFLIISWYWLSVITLSLVDGFAAALMPDLSSLIAAMLTFLSTSVSNPALGLLFAIVGGVSMWALQALYYLRDVLLYIALYGMPIAIALAFGNLPTISDIAMGFCKRFVPLALLPLPAVVVFTGYDLLYGEGILSPTTPFFGQLVAASLPFVAFFVTWKTFQFATPLTAKVLRTTAVGTATVGAVVTGAYIGGAGVGMTAARWGPKAAAGHAIVQGAASKSERSEHGETSPSYRRTENDPDHN